MAEENKTAVSDKVAIKNLRKGYYILFDDYRQHISRLHNADQKINMFLVFNAALIALLSLVFPLNDNSEELLITSIVFAVLFGLVMLATLITIVIGLFPKGAPYLNNKLLVDPEFYYQPEVDFMGKIMGQLNDTISALHNNIELKMRCVKIITIESVINFVIIFIMSIIKFL